MLVVAGAPIQRPTPAGGRITAGGRSSFHTEVRPEEIVDTGRRGGGPAPATGGLIPPDWFWWVFAYLVSAGARQHFDAEFKKWMAGEKSEVTTLTSRGRRLKPPISYDIRSLVNFTPDPLACESAAKLPDNWKSWPAYKVNVATEWQSEEGSPMTVITTYRLTWNTAEKRWYVKEYF